jgi:hypothetical protein
MFLSDTGSISARSNELTRSTELGKEKEVLRKSITLSSFQDSGF